MFFIRGTLFVSNPHFEIFFVFVAAKTKITLFFNYIIYFFVGQAKQIKMLTQETKMEVC